MPTATTGPSAAVLDLDEKSAARILEQSARAQAHTSLVLKVDAEATVWPGCILELRGQRVFLAIKSSVFPRPPADAYCEITVHLHGRKYVFTTSIVDVVEKGHANMLTVVRPSVIQTLQRRRFLRAQVADTTTVSVCDRDAFEKPRFSGLLLNVSRDGLACRVECREADRFAVDAEVGLSFVLGAPEPTYHMNAVIKAKTPAATPGQIILRLQFLRSESCTAQADRLGEALEAAL